MNSYAVTTIGPPAKAVVKARKVNAFTPWGATAHLIDRRLTAVETEAWKNRR